MHEYTDPAIRITLLPRDTNSRGTIFGGVILSYIDTAGAIEAHRHTSMERFVTVAMKEVIFHKPVFVLSLIHISEPTRLLSISYAVFCLKKKKKIFFFFFFLMIRRPPRSTLDRSSAASDVYKRQVRYRGDEGSHLSQACFC